MNKLVQQEAPARIWIQVLESDDAALPEPLVFSESDDWYASVFNSYFLASFKKENEGVFNQDAEDFSLLKPLLENFFETDALADLHRQLCEKWLSESDPDAASGTWFSVSWKDFLLDDYSGPAVGFFYAEEEEVFLQLGDAELQVRTGLPLKKPAFGCLILHDEAGYRVLQFGTGPSYWNTVLFPFQAGRDDAFHGREFFKLCKSFSEEVLLKEPAKTREDQLGFLADSLAYTKEKQEVSFDSFRQDVLREPTLIDAFDEYKSNYADRRQWNPPDRFAISDQVQNQAGKFIRSVIKLDKNFHIYVHGNKERIEKGFDESKNLNYYTLWFDAEN